MDQEPEPRKEPPPHPNGLREARTRQGLTREGLRGLCAQLNDQEPARYRSVGLTTIRGLEAGLYLPKLGTAATLAKALGSTVGEIFPAGVDNPVKNPSGTTSITPGRKTGGRPKKNL